jgi:hypothetical protein
VIDDLPTVRNFFAHRNSETALKVGRLSLRYGLKRIGHATDFVQAAQANRPVAIIEDWLAELDSIISSMCA